MIEKLREVGLIRFEGAKEFLSEVPLNQATIDAMAFPENGLSLVSQFLGESIEAEKLNSSNYVSLVSKRRLVCRASRKYIEGTKQFYWYGFTPQNSEHLKQGEESSVVFCCGSENIVVVFPFEIFSPLLENMKTSPKKGSEKPLRHYHVRIYEEGNTLLLEQWNELPNLDITRFLLSADNI